MHNEPHDLIHELPECRDKIHDLKVENAHFRKLYDQYHVINKEIHRIEQGIESHSDKYTEDKKKERLSLKDQLFEMIKSK